MAPARSKEGHVRTDVTRNLTEGSSMPHLKADGRQHVELGTIERSLAACGFSELMPWAKTLATSAQDALAAVDAIGDAGRKDVAALMASAMSREPDSQPKGLNMRGGLVSRALAWRDKAAGAQTEADTECFMAVAVGMFVLAITGRGTRFAAWQQHATKGSLLELTQGSDLTRTQLTALNFYYQENWAELTELFLGLPVVGSEAPDGRRAVVVARPDDGIAIALVLKHPEVLAGLDDIADVVLAFGNDRESIGGLPLTIASRLLRSLSPR
jgi:hypothetical protein